MEKQLIEEFEQLNIQEDVKNHSRRVEALSLKIANRLIDDGYKGAINLGDLKIAARYHDIGKKDIPKKILNKPDKLTVEEMVIMKQHVKFSGKYAADRGFPSPVIKIILHHHESCNGNGYPFGLKSDALSIESKILKVSDIYDALTSDRPYRKAFNQNDALDIILSAHEEYDIDILRVLFEILGARNVESVRSA